MAKYTYLPTYAQSCHSNVYNGSIAYGQVVRYKRICSTEEKLNNHYEQSKQWLVKRGYVDTERIMLIQMRDLFQIQDKKVDNITLVLTYHPALGQLYEILRRAHKHVLILPSLHSGLPSPTRVAFRNPKTIRDKLVRSKLKEFKMLKKKRINFSFDCNSCCVVCFMTC